MAVRVARRHKVEFIVKFIFYFSLMWLDLIVPARVRTRPLPLHGTREGIESP